MKIKKLLLAPLVLLVVLVGTLALVAVFVFETAYDQESAEWTQPALRSDEDGAIRVRRTSLRTIAGEAGQWTTFLEASDQVFAGYPSAHTGYHQILAEAGVLSFANAPNIARTLGGYGTEVLLAVSDTTLEAGGSMPNAGGDSGLTTLSTGLVSGETEGGDGGDVGTSGLAGTGLNGRGFNGLGLPASNSDAPSDTDGSSDAQGDTSTTSGNSNTESGSGGATTTETESVSSNSGSGTQAASSEPTSSGASAPAEPSGSVSEPSGASETSTSDAVADQTSSPSSGQLSGEGSGQTGGQTSGEGSGETAINTETDASGGTESQSSGDLSEPTQSEGTSPVLLAALDLTAPTPTDAAMPMAMGMAPGAVPEPSVFSLLLAAVAPVLYARRRGRARGRVTVGVTPK